MHFYMDSGKQCLEMRGDLILTHNDNIVTSKVRSAAPTHIYNYRCVRVQELKRLRQKFKALWACAKFIFDSKYSERLPPRDE